MRNRITFRLNKHFLLYDENLRNRVDKKLYCAESFVTRFQLMTVNTKSFKTGLKDLLKTTYFFISNIKE